VVVMMEGTAGIGETWKLRVKDGIKCIDIV
jgi:hypothetical protein